MADTINPRIAELAIEIADCAAPVDLESSCTSERAAETEGFPEDSWYDLDSLDEDERTELAGVIEYCELRGLIKRHPTRPNLFQTLEP